MVVKLTEKGGQNDLLGRTAVFYYLIARKPVETDVSVHERVKDFVNPSKPEAVRCTGMYVRSGF